MVESVVVIMLLCLIFWGFLQAAILYNHERVLQFASFATARSAAVGFLPEIYTRVYRVAAIPASGTMLEPDPGVTQMRQLATETIVIPLFLGLSPDVRMNYQYWDQYNMRPTIVPNTPAADMVEESHVQEHPLEMPMMRAIERSTNVPIRMMQNIKTDIASHYQYYLQ